MPVTRQFHGRIASALAVATLAAAGGVAVSMMASPAPARHLFPILQQGVRRAPKSELDRLVGLLELQTKLPAVSAAVSTQVVGVGAIGKTRIVLADTNVGYCLWRIGANMTCHSSSDSERGNLWVLSVAPSGREQMVIAVPNGQAAITATTSAGSMRIPVQDDLVFLDSTKVNTLSLGPSGPVLAVPHPGPRLLRDPRSS